MYSLVNKKWKQQQQKKRRQMNGEERTEERPKDKSVGLATAVGGSRELGGEAGGGDGKLAELRELSTSSSGGSSSSDEESRRKGGSRDRGGNTEGQRQARGPSGGRSKRE